jgi:hypothetical protein
MSFSSSLTSLSCFTLLLETVSILLEVLKPDLSRLNRLISLYGSFDRLDEVQHVAVLLVVEKVSLEHALQVLLCRLQPVSDSLGVVEVSRQAVHLFGDDFEKQDEISDPIEARLKIKLARLVGLIVNEWVFTMLKELVILHLDMIDDLLHSMFLLHGFQIDVLR